MKRAVSLMGIAMLCTALLLTGCSLLQTTPMVDFTPSKTNGHAPLAVRFTPETEGTPVSYSWSFGDGDFSEEPSPAHVYTRHGTYSVMLSVEFADQPGVTLVKKHLITVETQLLQASQDALYWISEYKVHRSLLNGSNDEVLANNWMPPSGLAVAEESVYWVWTDLIGGVIESSTLDGSARQKLVEEENRIGDIAIDTKRGKIYWTSLPMSPRSAFETGSWDGGIRRANLDGSNVETLIEYPAGSATYADRIAVDPVSGILVWTVVGDGYEGAIRRAVLAPFDVLEGNLVTGSGRPAGMTLDTIAGIGADNIYYTTAGELRRVGLYWYGSEATLLTGLDEPGGVSVDPIRYYVYVGTADGVLRAVTDGTDAERLFPVDQGVGGIVLQQ